MILASNRTKTIITLVIVAILIAVPITLLLVRQRQETRSRAAGLPVTLLLTPTSQTISPNQEFNVQVALNAADNDVTGVDFRFSYTSFTLQIVSFTPSNVFNSVLVNGPADTRVGTYRYAAVNTSSTPITGLINLGTLRLKGISQGTGTVSFQNIQIVGAGILTALPTQNNSTGTYIVSATAVTPTCTPGARDCITPTPPPAGGSPTPTCIPGTRGCLTPTPLITFPPTRHCRVDQDCPAGLVCNSIVGICVPSVSTPTPTVPQSVGCNIACRTNFDCSGGLICNLSAGVCRNSFCPTDPDCICAPTPTTPPTGGPPTPTLPPGATSISISILLPGIGGGVGSNTTPTRPTRQVTVSIFNEQNQQVVAISGNITFNGVKYLGAIPLAGIASGNHTVKVKLNNSLNKLIPGIHNIILGQANTLPDVLLISGDINQSGTSSNVLDLADYNAMIDCIKLNTSCTTSQKLLSDLNDDGKVEEIDLNILQRGFASRQGD